MPFTIKTQQRGLLPKMKARQRQRLIAATMGIIAAKWHDRYSQGKFTTSAATRYNYSERNTKSIRKGTVRKDRFGRPRAPNPNPLVWKGTTRRLSQQRTIRATSKRSWVASPNRALNFKPPGNKALQTAGKTMRDEYKRVLPKEERVLARDGQQFMRRQFRSGKTNFTVTTK